MGKRLKGELREQVFKHTLGHIEGAKFEFRDQPPSKLHKLLLAEQDVAHAIDCIEKAIEVKEAIPELDELILSGLWQEAIMSYGRCFVKPISLQHTSFFFEEYSCQFHDELMALRHKYIGHRQDHNRSSFDMVIVPTRSENGYSLEYYFPGAIALGHYLGPLQTIDHIRVLQGGVKHLVQQEIAKLDKLLWKDPELLRWFVEQEQAHEAKTQQG